MSLPDYIEETKAFLLEQEIPEKPAAAVILGSGLGGFTREIENPRPVPYKSIPHFPHTSVEGHKGKLVAGTINGHSVIAFSGRFHHYEGFTFEQTVLPVYVAHSLSSQKLIISNAAGAINTSFKVGDLMVIEDIMRLNLSISPRGHKQYRYTHYPWSNRVSEIASDLGINVQRGTYMYVKGPNYETKAEIKAFRRMGADAVGMSTAPELMEASRIHLKTAAVSLISNMATGVRPGKLSHDEISETAGLRKNDFVDLVGAMIEEL